MGHKNEVALALRKAAQFAAGFGFAQGDPSGVATAGTAAQISPTLGQRVRGGFGAISPGFRQFEESRAGLERTSAETNLALEKVRRSRLEEEQLNKPFDVRRLVGVADPGGGLGQAIEQELARVGADIDGNGVTTQVEFNKALNSGKVDFGNINKAFDTAIVSSDKDVIAKRGAFKSKLDSINKKQIEAGQPPFTESDFRDPSFRSTFSSEAVEFDKITSAEQRNAMLKGRQKMVSNFAQQQGGDFQRLRKIDVVAKSVGVDLDRPITKEEAAIVLTELKKFGDSFMEALFRQRFGGGTDVDIPSDRTFGNPLGLSDSEIKNLEQ